MTDARMLRLCGTGDLGRGEARRFDVDGVRVCLARCADGFHAVADICSHEDFSLSEGEVDPEACEIECWKHGSLFSLVSGEPLTLPATRAVAVYEVSVEGADVMVRLP
ncbi:MAG: non-heme iron oxygenase ferredoxin subunit [Acidimicrobiales bacterium]